MGLPLVEIKMKTAEISKSELLEAVRITPK
jgi:hypothetical protein